MWLLLLLWTSYYGGDTRHIIWREKVISENTITAHIDEDEKTTTLILGTGSNKSEVAMCHCAVLFENHYCPAKSELNSKSIRDFLKYAEKTFQKLQNMK